MEDRIRHGGTRSRRAVEAGIGLILLKGTFALVVLLFVMTAFNSALRTVTSTLQRPTPVVHMTSPTLSARPPVAAPAPAPRMDSQGSPCGELIDKRSDTIDYCMQEARAHAPTAADIREAQRKADEAIRVLAPNTPEM